MKDPFTVAYLSGASVLVAAEFAALFRRKPGDTITEKVKASRLLHSLMSSLLTWGVWHFVVNDAVGHDSLAANLGVAIAGGAAGAAVNSSRATE